MPLLNLHVTTSYLCISEVTKMSLQIATYVFYLK